MPSPGDSTPPGPATDNSEASSTEGDKTNTPREEGEPGGEGEGSEQGGSGGAYNPETGEINWDCPCLGGMAHGPCGPEFREAFSCFVFSEAEPKGIDCVEKFKAMQDCFRRHPDVYSDGSCVSLGFPIYYANRCLPEIMDDDEEEAANATSGSEPVRSEEGSSSNNEPTPSDSIPQPSPTPPDTTSS